jgi:hypothetical protein
VTPVPRVAVTAAVAAAADPGAIARVAAEAVAASAMAAAEVPASRTAWPTHR